MPEGQRHEAPPAGVAGRVEATPRWFWVCLALATLLGFAVRGSYASLSHVPDQPAYLVDYDPIYYHLQGLAVAHGRGFLDPTRPGTVPSAAHPPGLTAAVAVATKLGFSSFRSHRALTVLLGTAAIPIIGLLGALVAGHRAGAVAAALAAIYPGLWANDGLLMPESLYAPLVAIVLLLAYRAWNRPTWIGAAGLGATITIASFSRGEGVLLVPFLGGAVALWGPAFHAWRQRLAWFAVVVASFTAVLAPWTVYNLRRFQEPVILSTAAESTLAGANCDVTAGGENFGYWSTRCFDHLPPSADDSTYASAERHLAFDYIRGHLSSLPILVAVRVGRVWSVFRPAQEVSLNGVQNRPRWSSWLTLATYPLLVILSAVGVVQLRRRRRGIAPLVAMFVMVTVVAAVFYGNTRFRVPAEIALVVLASVPLAGLLPSGRQPTHEPPS